MPVYTSYFGNIKKMNSILSDFVFFSVAGKTPEWFEKKNTKRFKKLGFLAPKYEWWKEWHDRFSDNLESVESKKFYTERYDSTVLSKLDIDRLREIFEDCDGIPVLLCYETPEKFCHRHLISDFLNKHNIKCEEWN